MVYLSCRLALMLLLSWLIVLSTSTGLSYNKGPFGPKICEIFCRTISECDHFEFSAMDLECFITDANDTRKPDNGHTLFYIDSRSKLSPGVKCPKFRKVIATRSRKAYCDEGIAHRLKVLTRLLVTEKEKATQESKQINLRNYTVSPYLLDAKQILAITYVPDQDKLIVAEFDSQSLWSYNLDQGRGRILRRKTIVYSMAVLENQNLIFLSALRPKGLGRMQTDGNGYKVIWKTSHVIRLRVAVSSRQSRVYMSNGSAIICVGFDGNDNKVLQRGYRIRAISLDHDNDVLYFNSNTQIKFVSLSDSKSYVLVKVNSKPHGMIYFEGQLFMSLLRNEHFITVKEVNNTHLERKIPIGGKGELILCLIP